MAQVTTFPEAQSPLHGYSGVRLSIFAESRCTEALRNVENVAWTTDGYNKQKHLTDLTSKEQFSFGDFGYKFIHCNRSILEDSLALLDDRRRLLSHGLKQADKNDCMLPTFVLLYIEQDGKRL